MRVTKWIFFAYLALVLLVVGGIAVSFDATPPRNPDTLYSAIPGAVKTLDPAEVNDTIGSALEGQIYECLYNYRYNPEHYELFPELAAEMPQVSPDQMSMTVRLRHGVRFYDPGKVVWPDGKGPEVKAADVVYSLKRIADFNLASPNYSSILEDAVVGVDKWWEYTQNTAEEKIDWDRPVDGLEVVDEYTIRLKFTKPNPQMIYHLAHEPTGVVSREAVRHWGKLFRKHPVGTGPYALTEYLPEQRMVMTPNPLYRGRPDLDGTTPLAADDPQRMPHVQRLQYEYFSEDLPVWVLFKQGLFDIAGIPKDAFRQAIGSGGGDLTPEMRAKGVLINKTPEAATEFLGFNMQDPVVGKNKPLRQAMSMAFDRPSYIRNFLNGRGLAAIGPIPPGFPTFDPGLVNPYTRYDLPRARELMKEAERINGGPIPPIKLLMRDSDTLSRQMAEYFAGQMKPIGVTLVPEYYDFARWNEMVDNRQTQVFDAGWLADYPDEQNFYQLFYSKNGPNTGVNQTVYNNPAFDALYEKASVLPDTPGRRDLYRKMGDIVMEDCPWLLECYPVLYRLHYDWVGDIKDMDYGHGYRQYLTLDKDLRVRRQMMGGGAGGRGS